jgi:hypothetical protein
VRRRWTGLSTLSASIWDTIAEEAARESAIWREALLGGDDRELEPVFSPLGEERHALGLETIYEGYLVHYGRPRLFAPPDGDTALLLGDYLYAHGLVRVASLGNTVAVHDLAELISLCARMRGDSEPGDGVVWAATATHLGSGALEGPRRAFRETGDLAALESLVDGADEALAAHAGRVG